MIATKNLALPTRRYHLGFGIAFEGLRYFSGWILAATVLAVVLPSVVSQWRSIDISTWYFVANAGKFFTAIVAGGFLFTLLPNMVAQGLTRREFAVSMGLLGLLWSAILGAFAILVFLGEHAFYSAFDWQQAIQDDSGDMVLTSAAGVLEFAATYPLSYLVFFTGGALIGAASYRSDAGWLVLIAVVPVGLAVDDALSGTFGSVWLVQAANEITGGWGTWTAVTAAVAVIALGAWITRKIMVDSPIRSKKA